MNNTSTISCAILLCFGTGLGDDKATIDKLASDCSAGNHAACLKLAAIAKTNVQMNIRKAAVEKLADKALLAQIALEDTDISYVAIQQLSALSTQAKTEADDQDRKVRLIIQFARAFDSVPDEHRERLMTAVFPAVRILSSPALVSEFGDIVSIKTDWESTSQAYLGTKSGNKPGEIFSCSIQIQKAAEPFSHTWKTHFPGAVVALNFWSANVNLADLLQIPFSKIADTDALEKIALNDPITTIRKAAVEKLSNQALISRIAVNDKDGLVREAAVGRLSDQGLLSNIAMKDKTENVRIAAVGRLSDPALLYSVAKNTYSDEYLYSQVRLEATKKLSNQAALSDIAKNDKISDVREAAVEKLADQVFLASIAQNDPEEYVRRAAVEKLTDQNALANIVRHDKSVHVIISALEKINDQSLLAYVAKKSRDDDARVAAIRRLTDRTLLADIAKTDPNGYNRQVAEERLKQIQEK